MSGFFKTQFGWLAAAAGLVLAAAGSGCTTDAFCWRDCDSGATSSSSSSGAGGQGGAGGCDFLGGCGGHDQGGSGGTGGCVPTNDGIEICDKKDNDCNEKVDDLADWSKPAACGTCDNNCYELLLNNNPDTIKCVASSDPGNAPGTCTGDCAQDYFDLDNDEICEYYCVKDPAATDDSSCNNKDDDCDGVKDEDVDLCSSITDCGKCGGTCVVLHGTPACVHTGAEACDATNTQCKIQSCDPGFYDLDGSYATGCEYQCDVSNGGVEICGDSLDNDCDGKIDDADDDLSGDPQLGQPCFGDPDGECATQAHVGSTICQGNKVVCAGPNVLVENQQLELCNTKDDDCDGVVDDSPSDAGKACGISNVFPCAFGTQQCQNGALVCVGNIDPKAETCDGEDNDCDGNIDKTGNNPPPDSVGACNVPPPPPSGATSPCKAGNKACVGGAITCVGSVTPAPGTKDGCNIDANCDGVLTDQPDTQSDVNNCGGCGKSCLAGAVHSTWACVSGTCAFQGCEPGYYDLNNDKQCEYACVFLQAQETCNGVDDNCNGQIDEGVVAPSAVQVCGVSPSATSAECTSQVSVTCQGGQWKCGFPASVCVGGCSADDEICDGLDNDCDGLKNENVANWNKACVSDEGLPSPGHGACRTTGVYVCATTTTTACNAVKADCTTLPGGCTELCDGIDNDCDGVADEPYSAKGNNATYYVKPAVTPFTISGGTKYITTYEVSRPSATSVVPGTGNGFWTSAPTGTTLDKTPACSVQGKIPWFNVTPREVEQVCQAAGGSVCLTAEWQAAARLPSPDACLWGYAPFGTACKTNFVAGTKFCNIGPSYDFDAIAPGDQDGLLVAGSSVLKNCWTEYSSTSKIFDITGNLREITKISAVTKQYPLLGGAFNTQSEDGAKNNFTFYTVDENFQFFDTGFRCCFSSNPS